MSLLSVENLSVAYGANTVLSHVDLHVEAGEIITIVGPNGSGKTSLLRAIIGAVQPATGAINRAPSLTIGYGPRLTLCLPRSPRPRGRARPHDPADVAPVGRPIPTRPSGPRAA
jgi:ABC-type Mn2+/Zn2+ transport system ATPase subunit